MKNKSFIVLALIATALLLTSTSLTLSLKNKELKNTVSSDVIETKLDNYPKVISLTNLGEATITGSATIEEGATVSENALNNYTVSVFDSLDTVEYTFDIINTTDDDLEIADINFNIPECVGLGENGVEDAKKVCSAIKYQLLDSNNEEVSIYDRISKNETKSFKTRLIFNENNDESLLPETTVEVTNLNITFAFQKAE